MRIAVMVIGLILGAIMFVQTFLVNTLSQAGGSQTEASEVAGAMGLAMSLLWLLACALVIPFPLVSTALFLLSAVVGFGFAGAFPDLAYWGAAALLLATFSVFGWSGKRRSARREMVRRETEARDRQADVDRAVAAGVAAATSRPERLPPR